MRTTTTVRRWKALGGVTAATLMLAACGGGQGSNGTDGTNGTDPDGEPVAASAEPSMFCGEECQEQLELEADPASIECSVGVSWNSAAHPYGARHTQEIPQFARSVFPGMQVSVGDGQGDSTTQSSQVDDMVAQGIDVLIISPADASALAGAVDRAKEAGVQVVAADRAVDTEVATTVGSDNVEAGEVSGQAVVDLLDGSGTVVELAGSLGASPTIDRGAGFRTVVEGSGVEIIGSQTANYDRAEGLRVMEDFLQRFGSGQIDAVYAHNDQMAFGAIQAIEEAGRSDEILVVGIDAEQGALEAVQEGTYAATVAYPAVVQESTLAAAKLCAGEDVDERIVLDSTLIDSSNVEEFFDRPAQ